MIKKFIVRILDYFENFTSIVEDAMYEIKDLIPSTNDMKRLMRLFGGEPEFDENLAKALDEKIDAEIYDYLYNHKEFITEPPMNPNFGSEEQFFAHSEEKVPLEKSVWSSVGDFFSARVQDGRDIWENMSSFLENFSN